MGNRSHKKVRQRTSSNQFDLFAVVAPSEKGRETPDQSSATAAKQIDTSLSAAIQFVVGPCVERGRPPKPVLLPLEATGKAQPPVRRATLVREATSLRSTTVADMPEYSELDQELVDRSIAGLPSNRMWFTYSAIRESFGISRATVARKVKLGLVPGIRFHGASVIEDGPVRRFDRGQLRWLLLSVRSRRHPT